MLVLVAPLTGASLPPPPDMGAVMSVIRIEDVAYVRFSVPDLHEAQRFLSDFGLFSWRGSGGRVYACAQDGQPFSYAAVEGNPKFLALGLRAASLADLEALAAFAGAECVGSEEPGGGRIIQLTDPDGLRIEVVAGQAVSRQASSSAEPERNSSRRTARIGSVIRRAAGPARVSRLGHVVLEVADFRRSEAWYKDRFGFLTSDAIISPGGEDVGAFLRSDRGDRPTDHHSLFLLQTPRAPAFGHAAFEVEGLDELMGGRDHLLQAGHRSSWGVGRHILGSQIFDYWRDPWGFEFEHWTDGDLLTAAHPPGRSGLADLLRVQWGAEHPLVQKTGRRPS